MQINIFSGGRRIAFALGFIIACLAALFAFLVSDTRPVEAVVYSIEMKQPVKRAAGCNYNDDSTRQSVGTVYEWFDVDVVFCFRSIKLEDGQYIPYTNPSGEWMAGQSYSDEVDKYERDFIREFVIPSADRIEAATIARENVHRVFLYSMLAFAGAAVAVWIITYILGWIVRGFLGVPRGQDFRPPQL
ncbi:MAG: hypothetical protein IPK59_08445 [Rhodospirillaceae bacterium]|nr:hypothetical protein [Rhodospirillaceae bacterium]